MNGTFLFQSRKFSHSKVLPYTVPYEVSSCITAMDKYCMHIERKEEMNKAAVRLVYVNTIAYMVCVLNNFFVWSIDQNSG